MSSILEALKKLEDEKATQQSGSGPIAGKVVKSGRRAKQRPKWLLPLEMMAVAAIAVLATYLIIGGRSTPLKTESPPPLAGPPQKSSQPEPYLAPPLPAEPVSSMAPTSQWISKAPPAKKSAPANKPPVDITPGQRSHAVTAQSAEPTTPAKQDAKPVPPPLQVTGIAWQKDNADRLAIVNGRQVGEGAVIEGAKVEEILPDRVRFSIDGRIIEVSLGRSAGEKP
ncbi:MAG TPA: general secretion pathway protein GspB [Geobacteraceae bacterium]|nr:general secretion pathway protein GspB [Geobacteraceae bacterium]